MVLKPSIANQEQLPPFRNELVTAIEQARKLPFHERRKAIRELSGILNYESHVSIPYFLVDGTNFLSNIWHVKFAKDSKTAPLVIDFGIELSDGSLLTEEQHAALLYWMKLFLVLQSHPRYNGQRHNSALYERRKLVSGLHFLDWIILNDQEFDVVHNRFSLITVDNIKSYLKTTLGTPLSDRIYAYPTYLALWIREGISHLTDDDYAVALKELPCLENLPALEDRVLDLSDEELRKAKAWIYLQKHTSPRYGNLYFNPSVFQKQMYRNTLYGHKLQFRVIEDLRITDVPQREFPGVPVTQSNMEGTALADIQHTLMVLKKICIIEAHYTKDGISGNGILEIQAPDIFTYVENPKQRNRFATLPHDVVIDLLGDCFQFYTDNAKVVLKCVIGFFQYKIDHGFGRASAIDSRDSIVSSLGAVDQLNIRPTVWYTATRYSDQKAYLDSLRANESLFDSYRVTLGSFLVVLGGLTSKRQGEIIDLNASNCLQPMLNPYLPENDSTEYCLRYLARKTGDRTKRELASVGITHQLAKMLWDFVSFRAKLVEMGLADPYSPLLLGVLPRMLEFPALSPLLYNSILDIVCDYFQTPTITIRDIDHRYYVRQHQLRRFCALAFYHADNHGRIEVIQHLLGHSDPEHVYQYISESVPGVVLLEAKAQRITSALMSGIDDIDGLNLVKGYLTDRFCVSDIHLKTISEIDEDYSELISAQLFSATETPDYFTRQSEIFQEVAEMLEAHVIDLQPEFFTYHDPVGDEIRTFKLFIKMVEAKL